VQLKFRVSVYGLGYVLAKMSSCIAQYYCLLVARRATAVYGLGYVLAKMSSCIAQYYCLLVARRATAAVSDKQGRV